MQTITIFETVIIFIVCILLYVFIKTIKQHFFNNKTDKTKIYTILKIFSYELIKYKYMVFILMTTILLYF